MTGTTNGRYIITGKTTGVLELYYVPRNPIGVGSTDVQLIPTRTVVTTKVNGVISLRYVPRNDARPLVNYLG